MRVSLRLSEASAVTLSPEPLHRRTACRVPLVVGGIPTAPNHRVER